MTCTGKFRPDGDGYRQFWQLDLRCGRCQRRSTFTGWAKENETQEQGQKRLQASTTQKGWSSRLAVPEMWEGL
jgi:hypothetical protein